MLSGSGDPPEGDQPRPLVSARTLLIVSTGVMISAVPAVAAAVAVWLGAWNVVTPAAAVVVAGAAGLGVFLPSTFRVIAFLHRHVD